MKAWGLYQNSLQITLTCFHSFLMNAARKPVQQIQKHMHPIKIYVAVVIQNANQYRTGLQ